ncbi:MAG: HK97 family phage prohead protease, partial [Alphaproteobacteria bacterium]
MGEVFIDESGRPLEIRAYVARFNEPSVPLPEHSGAVETIAPFAFSPVTADLAAGRVPPPILDAEHEPGWQILAAGDADFDVWQDAVGFAVAISNINVSARTLAFLKWIGSRQRPAMSFAGQWLYAAGSREAGRPRILAVNELRSISITDRPAYRSTAVWLSTNTAHDLRRSDAYALLATWQEGREATTKARAGV